MKMKYNVYEFNKANDALKVNLKISKELFEEYLVNYPYDYSTYINYAYLLLRLDNTLNARKVCEYVQALVEKDFNYKNSIKYERFKSMKLKLTFTILVYEGKFKEAYDLYINSSRKFIIEELPILYISKMLGREDKMELKSYTSEQINNYSYDLFLDHIKKHLIYLPRNDNKTSLFKSDIQIEEIIKEIRRIIPNSIKERSNAYSDVYYFKYNNCGYNGKKKMDYFKVIAIHDTNNLLTMHPIIYEPVIEYIDLNYLNNKEEVATKKLSQIDKFNKRYGIK